MESFKELDLKSPIAQAVDELGFVKPSPIQAQTLPILLGEPTDFIGLAATGTGKTAAFGIPLLENIDPKKRVVQALILCPTRELSLQVAGQIDLLGKHLKISTLPVYGGAGYGEQLRGLRNGCQVVIGTPGRLIDHLERGTLNLEAVSVVVLDEADEMISMGFREDMETILKKTNRESSNIWLFSATMGSSVRRVADQFLKRPKMVQVNRSEMLSSTVQQSYFVVQEANKPEMLCRIIDSSDDFYGLIFCQTKALVMDLMGYLTERGYKPACLQGDMSQSDREATMSKFRSRKVKVLVCTDVAARGLDVKEVSHVINYSIPRELDSYVHRIGRTARSGSAGQAISFVTPSHKYLLKKIEQLTKSRIAEGVVPTRKAIGAKKITGVLADLLEIKGYERAIEAMDDAWKNAIANLSSQEMAARFLAMMYPELFGDVKRDRQTLKSVSEDEPRQRRRNGNRDSRHERAGNRSQRRFRQPGRRSGRRSERRAD